MTPKETAGLFQTFAAQGLSQKPDSAQTLTQLHGLLQNASLATFSNKEALPDVAHQLLTSYGNHLKDDPQASEQAMKMVLTEVDKHPDEASKQAVFDKIAGDPAVKNAMKKQSEAA